MKAIAFVISIVCVRPAPWSGRSDATRTFPLPFWIAEHDDAGSGVAPERATAPTVTASAATASAAASAPPAMMRFFTRPPVLGGWCWENINARADREQ